MPMKRMIPTLVTILAFWGVLGCGGATEESASPTPPVETAPPATATAEPAAEAVTLTDNTPGAILAIQPDSRIGFVGTKVTGSHTGSFDTITGQVAYVPGAPERSKVHAMIDLTSFETDAARLTEHLKSADFFHVAEFPQAHFNSTRIVKTGANYTVTGLLSFHGVEKEITFPATVTEDAGKLHVVSNFMLNRMDFGVSYTGKPDDPISEQVQINLDIHAASGGLQ